MQERCPHCGNYHVGPAYPAPNDRPLIAWMLICMAATLVVAAFTRIFDHIPPFRYGDWGYHYEPLVAFLSPLVVAIPFALTIWMQRREEAARAHVRMCRSCGYRWTI